MNNIEANPPASTSERWIRLPKSGVCPWCGLSRSHLFELIRTQKVKSVSLRKPGNVKGPRLVWLPSVFQYIEREGQDGMGVDSETGVSSTKGPPAGMGASR